MPVPIARMRWREPFQKTNGIRDAERRKAFADLDPGRQVCVPSMKELAARHASAFAATFFVAAQSLKTPRPSLPRISPMTARVVGKTSGTGSYAAP
jgi:hypothetical protein